MMKVVTDGIRSGKIRNDDPILEHILKQKPYLFTNPRNTLPPDIWREVGDARRERAQKTIVSADAIVAYGMEVRAHLGAEVPDPEALVAAIENLAQAVVLRAEDIHLPNATGLTITPLSGGCSESDWKKTNRILLEMKEEDKEYALLKRFRLATATLTEIEVTDGALMLYLESRVPFLGFASSNVIKYLEQALDEKVKAQADPGMYVELVRCALKLYQMDQADALVKHLVEVESKEAQTG